MKYVLAILLVAGTMQAQTRAQLTESNRFLREALVGMRQQLDQTQAELAEANAKIEQMKVVQQIFIDFINEQLNKPAPQPVIVRQNVPVFVPEPYAVPEPQTIRVIHDDAPYVAPVWEDTVYCSGYDIPTPGLTLTYSNCR